MTIVQLDSAKRQTEQAAGPSIPSPLANVSSQSLIRIAARVAFAVAVLAILCTWRQTGIW